MNMINANKDNLNAQIKEYFGINSKNGNQDFVMLTSVSLAATHGIVIVKKALLPLI